MSMPPDIVKLEEDTYAMETPNPPHVYGQQVYLEAQLDTDRTKALRTGLKGVSPHDFSCSRRPFGSPRTARGRDHGIQFYGTLSQRTGYTALGKVERPLSSEVQEAVLDQIRELMNNLCLDKIGGHGALVPDNIWLKDGNPTQVFVGPPRLAAPPDDADQDGFKATKFSLGDLESSPDVHLPSWQQRRSYTEAEKKQPPTSAIPKTCQFTKDQFKEGSHYVEPFFPAPNAFSNVQIRDTTCRCWECFPMPTQFNAALEQSKDIIEKTKDLKPIPDAFGLVAGDRESIVTKDDGVLTYRPKPPQFTDTRLKKNAIGAI